MPRRGNRDGERPLARGACERERLAEQRRARTLRPPRRQASTSAAAATASSAVAATTTTTTTTTGVLAGKLHGDEPPCAPLVVERVVADVPRMQRMRREHARLHRWHAPRRRATVVLGCDGGGHGRLRCREGRLLCRDRLQLLTHCTVQLLMQPHPPIAIAAATVVAVA